MACILRERTGSCNHHQCEYPQTTVDGYDCVDLYGGFCEMGLNCVDQCAFSFTDERAEEAAEWMREPDEDIR